MDDQEIIKLIREEIRNDKRDAQYGVSRVPFHVHNNLDSPPIPFIGLGDVPNSYSGQTTKVLQVNSTETGLQFTNYTFLALTDTPDTYSGSAGKVAIVNSGATALIFGGKLGNTGPLFDHYATVGNVTTGETDLYSDTLAAGTLASNGDKLEIGYGGAFVSSGTATREIKIYFGGTIIFDTGALTLSLSSAWTAYAEIIRVSATVIRYMVSMTTEGAALAAYTAVGEVTGLTLANTNVLKITGQAAGVGAATNDILAKMGYVLLFSAA